MKRILIFALLICVNSLVIAQNITKIEYWINTDPGFGAATNLTGFTPSQNISNLAYSVPANIAPGIYTIGIRSMDANNVWSHTNMFSALVFTPPANPDIDSIEYFINSDPSLGNATVVNGVVTQQNIQNMAIGIPATLSPGIHAIGVRSHDAEGNWSHTNFFPVLINDTSTAGAIVALEYFWDTDTGFYFNMPYTPSQLVVDLNNEMMNVHVPLNFSLGLHTLFIRSLDSKGRWSHTNYRENVEVTPAVSVAELKELLGINIFPNPFHGELNIKQAGNTKTRLIIYDLNGKSITDRWVEETLNINTNDWAQGVYTVYLWSEINKIYSLKLIKN